MCIHSGDPVAPMHQPTPASLRARIAELRIRQKRVAENLGMSEVQLSHILVERRAADLETLTRIATAIETVAGSPA